MTKKLPILYSFRRCPYAMRARMAIVVSGLSVQLREVVLRAKPAAMLVLSPKATVPILQLPDGEVVDESFDIMLWALRQADPFGWLQPDACSLDDMKALVAVFDGDFKDQLDGYKYANRVEGAVAEDHRKAAGPYLLDLEHRLTAYRFLCGKKPSLADYAIMPFIRQFAHVDRGYFAALPYPSLQRWLAGMVESPVFTRVMEKHKQWQDGDTPVIFPP